MEGLFLFPGLLQGVAERPERLTPKREPHGLIPSTGSAYHHVTLGNSSLYLPNGPQRLDTPSGDKFVLYKNVELCVCGVVLSLIIDLLVPTTGLNLRYIRMLKYGAE